jgi:DNA-directed RNA polymerase specialized sigma24 family protein
VEREEGAWSALYLQYQRLVGKWVGSPPDRIDEYVNRAFDKFSHAVDPESFSSKFPTVEKVMAYLRMCARSVRIDAHRREEKHQLLVNLEDIRTSTGDTTSQQAIEGVMRQELFSHIEGRLKDKQERLVMHLSFKMGLAPREIVRVCPDTFDSVAEVRRVKERIVRRLSNDLQLQDWWAS